MVPQYETPTPKKKSQHNEPSDQELHQHHEDWLLNDKYTLPAPVLVIDANKDMGSMIKANKYIPAKNSKISFLFCYILCIKKYFMISRIKAAKYTPVVSEPVLKKLRNAGPNNSRRSHICRQFIQSRQSWKNVCNYSFCLEL